MEKYKRDFMNRNIAAALIAGVCNPVHTAAAAALESKFGVTEACIAWNNPFNVRLYGHPKHGLHLVPQSSFEGKPGWRSVSDVVSFETLVMCYENVLDSIGCLGDNWPADNAADQRLEADARVLVKEYLTGEIA